MVTFTIVKQHITRLGRSCPCLEAHLGEVAIDGEQRRREFRPEPRVPHDVRHRDALPRVRAQHEVQQVLPRRRHLRRIKSGFCLDIIVTHEVQSRHPCCSIWQHSQDTN